MFSDIILAILLILAMMYGWHRGLLRVLGGVGGLVIAFMLARKLSATLIPFLLQLLPPGEAVGTASAWQTVLAQLFYSNSLLGRIVELILFILLFGIITWLIHFLVGFTTRVLNLTPLGFVNRFLGLLAGFLVMAFLLSALSLWLVPAFAAGKTSGFWLVLSNMFTSSQYLLPIIEKIGLWGWALVQNPPQLPDLQLPDALTPPEA